LSLLRKNITANYFSQIYVALVGILLLPLYLKYLGSEAYGLVGFFAMLQAWFGILDLGLTPTISRETARFRAKIISDVDFRRLFRALLMFFLIIALVGCSALLLLSELLATKWLGFEELPLQDVIIALNVMIISVGLRWLCGLFRGVVTGSEKLVWLSVFNVIIATLRFIGVFISMNFFGFTPLVFFIHQLLVAIVEVTSLVIKASSLLPPKKSLDASIGWSFKPVKPVLKFSLTIAFTAAVWVFVTQTDKLVLSGILNLTDYGHFTLAVLVANGVMMISGPISSALMPRMARLNAEQKLTEMISIYRKSTQFVAVIAGSSAITLIITAEPLLYAWTGQRDIAKQAGPILQLYAAGNLFLCVAAFSYYLQYAKGDLRYHLRGNIGLVIVLIPGIVFAANANGGVGAGYVWLVLNVLFLFGWVAYVHHKLEPKLHKKWLLSDVLKIIVPSYAIPALSSLCFKDISFYTRSESLFFVGFIAFLTFCTAIGASNVLRSKASTLIGNITKLKRYEL